MDEARQWLTAQWATINEVKNWKGIPADAALKSHLGKIQKEMERRELGVQVQAGIDKLSPDLRTCVILRDIEELSYQEIVDLLKIPEGTVKSRINRGRIELAKILRRMKVVAMSET